MHLVIRMIVLEGKVDRAAIIPLLISRGANKTLKNDDGFTALQLFNECDRGLGAKRPPSDVSSRIMSLLQ